MAAQIPEPAQLQRIASTQHPGDWPGDGAIDLSVHDLPHASSTIEWWYVNCHLITEDNRNLSLFAAFFHSLEKDDGSPETFYGHALTWAIIDPDSQRYVTESLLDPRTPRIALKQLDDDQDPAGLTLKQALREFFLKGNVPLPDRLLLNKAKVNVEKLDLDYDGNRFIKLADGRYLLKLGHSHEAMGCELTFVLKKPPARHGKNGVVKGTQDEGMFYYFVPRCHVGGKLTVEGQELKVADGQGWYDHEFGRPGENEPGSPKVAWNWISIQLDNGYDISVYDLVYYKTGLSCGHSAIVIDPQGEWREYSTFSFEPTNHWTSSRTFERYPIEWDLTIPEIGFNVRVYTSYPQQEFITILSFPAFWEGRIAVTGHMQGEEIEGIGFVERSGFVSTENTTDFLKAVSRETQNSLHDVLPLSPTHNQLKKLVASEKHPEYIDGLDADQYAQAVLMPIRTITDRGGKAWRPYAFLACIDLVGGDSQSFMNWLGWPELLHVGSLIIDDVQDKSSIRRGGPSCHELYGEPLAINAGNACYFLAESLLTSSQISDGKKLRIYELYFETLRAAHAGQAIDLHGFSHLMTDVVRSGNGKLLEDRILSVYRLKSAVPASSLAQAGAILGGGTSEQVGGLGSFFEALGIAFQIMDDVLNLRGFENDLKIKGEDISEGKITLPVAKAMSILPSEKRELLWKNISSLSNHPEFLSETISLIECSGAIEACADQARQLVDSGWNRMDPLVPDSLIKARLRAFSWFVLNRHY